MPNDTADSRPLQARTVFTTRPTPSARVKHLRAFLRLRAEHYLRTGDAAPESVEAVLRELERRERADAKMEAAS